MEQALFTQMHPEQLKELIASGIKEELKKFFSNVAHPQKGTEILTIKEVCLILQCSKTTLWNWENKGFLIPIRIGRGVRYYRTDVENFINSKKQGL